MPVVQAAQIQLEIIEVAPVEKEDMDAVVAAVAAVTITLLQEQVVMVGMD